MDFDDEFVWFSAESVTGSEYDTFTDGDPGTSGVSTPPANLRAAVDLLVESVGVEHLSRLKIRAGEHLAAVITTCFLRSAPSDLDTDGEADLVFDDYRPAGWQLSTFSEKPPAFEVKSLERPDGGYRKYDSVIDRIMERDGEARGKSHASVFFKASQIIDMAADTIERARVQLVRKTDDHHARNVFLIVHLLDYGWVEIFSNFLAPHLEPLALSEDIDSIWVLWVPGRITVWSSRLNEWLNFVFGSSDPAKLSAADVDDIRDAEEYFFERIGYTGGSPFIWGYESSGDSSD